MDVKHYYNNTFSIILQIPLPLHYNLPTRPMLLLIVLLTIIGCLSPLLTFLALFQQKEWRMDRLLEHIRHEGAMQQLFGKVRPPLAGLMLLTDGIGITFVLTALSKESLILAFNALAILHISWLTVFALLSAAQFVLRKQRMPVWTMKAKMIGVMAFFFLSLLTFTTTPLLIVAPFLFLLQPVIGIAAWYALLPADQYLKTKHFAKAESIRHTWTTATVVGIAGSVGKTTTKELLKHVLSDLHPITTPEHVNTEMGVAQWMSSESRKLKTESAPVIIEMGAYRKGEIALMCQFVKPTIGVMTALGSDHLALFGSEEAIVEANAELLHALPQSGHAFLYADNAAIQTIVPTLDCHVTLAGIDEAADVRAEMIDETPAGLKLTIGSHTATIPLHGLHNVGNILLAVAVAKHLGIDMKRICELLSSFQPLTHTFHVRHEQGVLLVDDTYNSSRLSIRAALHWAKTKPERPRVLLLSGLLETGDQEDVLLKELGEIAKDSVERVIFLSKNGTAAFAEGFGKDVEILSPNTDRLATGSLLLALGRMPLSSIQKLLPQP